MGYLTAYNREAPLYRNRRSPATLSTPYNRRVLTTPIGEEAETQARLTYAVRMEEALEKLENLKKEIDKRQWITYAALEGCVLLLLRR